MFANFVDLLRELALVLLILFIVFLLCISLIFTVIFIISFPPQVGEGGELDVAQKEESLTALTEL